jgi:hypothetical protein
MSSVLSAAQEKKGTWQRVYTGEDSIIEINVSKVTFVEYNASRKVTFAYSAGRVGFRTIYSKPEALKETPGVKYKSRLETIEFQCPKKDPGVMKKVPPDTSRYRLYEAILLDAKGKVLKTYPRNPAEDWRDVRFGSMIEKLSVPACKLIDEKRRNP